MGCEEKHIPKAKHWMFIQFFQRAVWGPPEPANGSVSLLLKCTSLKSCHKMLQPSSAPQEKVADSW